MGVYGYSLCEVDLTRRFACLWMEYCIVLCHLFYLFIYNTVYLPEMGWSRWATRDRGMAARKGKGDRRDGRTATLDGARKRRERRSGGVQGAETELH